MQRRREITYDDGYNSEEDIPLHRKQAFGAGLKRKRVEFVPAKDPDAGFAATAVPKSTSTEIGDLYASIVLKEKDGSSSKDASSNSSTPKDESAPQVEAAICPVCSLPTTSSSKPHEVSLAHQVCLTHSYPPSALDRSRMGLRALKSQGWDPDARKGLGREGEGMMYPIKAVAKDDTLGVGAKIPENARKKDKVEKPKKLNPKEMRKLAEKERQRNERLQGEIFGRVDVERYLRGDG